nr:PQQ-dependent sugar dehydrogenase [Halopseudomonas laoshanensis]
MHDLETGETGSIGGVPEVVHAGQGGLGDVLLHPRFEDNQQVYLIYAEAGDGGSGAAVALARLVLDENGGGELEDLKVIWRQTPKRQKVWTCSDACERLQLSETRFT